jgi:micrococcal nuclease
VSRVTTRAAVVLALAVLVAGCTAGVSPSDSSGEGDDELANGVTVTVVEVTDGDTMDVRFPDGRVETVRLLGVDTPETYAENSPDEWEDIPDTQAGTDWLKTWGERATTFATESLAGEDVEIRTDPQADRRGGYDRLLVYISTPTADVSFNQRLVERGYARLYDTEFGQRDVFAAAEQSARADERGVWGFEAGADSSTATNRVVSLDTEADDSATDSARIRRLTAETADSSAPVAERRSARLL